MIFVLFFLNFESISNLFNILCSFFWFLYCFTVVIFVVVVFVVVLVTVVSV